MLREMFGCFLHDFGNKVVSSSWLLPLVFAGLGKLHLGLSELGCSAFFL